MRAIEDYFSSLGKFLRKTKAIVSVEPEHPFRKLDNVTGRVEARFHFFDGSYLDVGEMVRLEEGGPVNYHYRYHYQRPQGPVFTYDDAPHHPELETFPHHKHVYRAGKRRTEPYPRVSLIDVMKEILSL